MHGTPGSCRKNDDDGDGEVGNDDGDGGDGDGDSRKKGPQAPICNFDIPP